MSGAARCVLSFLPPSKRFPSHSIDMSSFTSSLFQYASGLIACTQKHFREGKDLLDNG